MYALRLALVGLITLALVGCTSNAGEKESAGTLLGALAGGLAGSQVGKGRGKLVATGVGTFLGAMLGSEIGRSLDRADRLAMQRTTQQTLEKAPVGENLRVEEPRLRQPGHDHPKEDLQTPGRNVLPRVHTDHYHRRPHRRGIRHRLPPARRNLETDLGLEARAAEADRHASSPTPRGGPDGRPRGRWFPAVGSGCLIATRAEPAHSFRARG